MYLFSRRVQILQGNNQSALHWVERISEKLTQISPLPASTYQTMFSPQVGTITWGMTSPDLESLETVNDKLQSDESFLSLVDEGGQYTIPTQTHDALIQIVYSHGQPLTPQGQAALTQRQQQQYGQPQQFGQQYQQPQQFGQQPQQFGQQYQQPFPQQFGQQQNPMMTQQQGQQQQQPQQQFGQQQQLQVWQQLQQQQQSNEYITATTAVATPGNLVRAIEVGTQIAQRVEQVTGQGVTFGLTTTGAYGQVVWSSAYPSVSQLDQSQQALLSNTDVTQFIDNKVKGVFSENFDITQQVILRRLRV